MIFWFLWLLIISVFASSAEAGDGTIRGGVDNGTSVPGLSAGVGDSSTTQFLQDLERAGCLGSLSTFYFDPFEGDDTTGDGSEGSPFRTTSKMNEVCTDPLVECRCKSGRAWGSVVELTTPSSGTFVIGERVRVAGGATVVGQALVLDYDESLGLMTIEDLLSPTRIYQLADSGTFTITHAGAETAAIAFDATAATVETELEALENLSEVSVSGDGGGPTTPWVISFIRPSRPVMALTASGSANPQIINPRVNGLGTGMTLTGLFSGATATTDALTETFTEGLAYDDATGCGGREPCFILRPTENDQCIFSANGRALTGDAFVHVSDAAQVHVEGVRVLRMHEDMFEIEGGGEISAVNWFAETIVPGAVQDSTILRMESDGRLFSANGSFSQTANGVAPTGNTGDSVRQFAGKSIWIGRGRLEKGEGNGNLAPVIAINADAEIQIVGHKIDAAQGPDGFYGALELGIGASSGDLHSNFQCFDCLLAGGSRDYGAFIISNAINTGTNSVEFRNSVFVGFSSWMLLGNLLSGSSSSFNHIGGSVTSMTGSPIYVNDQSSAGNQAIPKMAVTIQKWVHDDAGQTGDWTVQGTPYNTIEAFLQDSDVLAADWLVSAEGQKTSPTVSFADLTPTERTIQFVEPLPSYWTAACEEITSTKIPQRSSHVTIIP